MSEINDNSNESNSCSVGSDSTNSAGRLVNAGSNPIRTGVLRPSVLRSSVLGGSLSKQENNAATSANAAEPEKEKSEVKNPFLNIEHHDDEDEEKPACPLESESGTHNKKAQDDEEPDNRPDPLTLLRKNGLERSNLFAAAKNSIPRVEKSGFVFGQNVHERVVGDGIENSKKCDNDNNVPASELLFSSVIQNASNISESDSSSSQNKDGNTKSLNDVAREYEESRVQKRKYEEVETFTGEENEVNIVDINCKLFAFVNSNWEERGRGSLRLNDSKNEHECSRVVFRTSGNLRLLLNTKVWAGMVAEHPSQKSLRLTAMDSSCKIKIFLVMARPVDINQLFKALNERIQKRKASHPEECSSISNENNDGDQAKNDKEVIEAAAVAEPDIHDEAVEPSPKKPLVENSDN